MHAMHANTHACMRAYACARVQAFEAALIAWVREMGGGETEEERGYGMSGTKQVHRWLSFSESPHLAPYAWHPTVWACVETRVHTFVWACM